MRRRARCEANQFLYDQLNKLATIADLHKSDNASFCYRKALKSLESYPVPIISVRQAAALEGVGIKLLSVMGELIKRQYARFLVKPAPPPPLEGPPALQRVLREDQLVGGSLAEIPELSGEKIEQPKLLPVLAARGLADPLAFDLSIHVDHPLQDDPPIPSIVSGENFLSRSPNDLKQVPGPGNRQAGKPRGGGLTAAETELAGQLKGLMAGHEFRRYFGKSEFQGKRKPQRIFDSLVEKGIFRALDFESEVRYTLCSGSPDKGLPESLANFLSSAGQSRAAKEAASVSGTAGVNGTTEALATAGTSKVNLAIGRDTMTFHRNEVKNFRLVLQMDHREKNHASSSTFEEKFEMSGIEVARSALPLGDFLWTVELETGFGPFSFVADAIIERKTCDDLARSIIDGRYSDQKTRLLKCGVKRKFFLVEGNVESHPFAGLKTSLNATRILDRFSLIRTTNIKDSADFIVRVHKGLEDTLRLKMKEEIVSFDQSFANFKRNQTKFKNLSVGNASRNALKRLKGFGDETVDSLLQLSPTLAMLYERLNRIEAPENLPLLRALSASQLTLLVKLFTKMAYETEETPFPLSDP